MLQSQPANNPPFTGGQVPPTTTKANGSSGSHKPLAQVRQGVRVAAFKAATAVRLTEHEGLTVAKAALGCNDELVSAFRTGTPPNIEKYLG